MALGGAGSEVFRALSLDGQSYVAARLWCGANHEQQSAVLARVQRAAAVEHPVLAALEACLPRGNAALWIVSEYVPGPTLEAWVKPGRRLTIPALIDLVRSVCRGAQAAIRQGLCHHAIHPRNLLIWRQEGTTGTRVEAKLIDLALPAWSDPGLPEVELAHFMAPETLASALEGRDPSAAIDARANVFSCGALLYYLSTGALPYGSSGLQALTEAQQCGRLWSPSSHNPRVSAALETVILGALAVRAAERYANPGELASVLDAVEWRDGLASPASSPRAASGSRPATAKSAASRELPAAAPSATPLGGLAAARPS